MENDENTPLLKHLMRRASTVRGRDYEVDNEEFQCKPLGFLLALPFALVALVIALVGAVIWIAMSLVACLCPCFLPCIAIVDWILQIALGLIAAPFVVVIIIMSAMPC